MFACGTMLAGLLVAMNGAAAASSATIGSWILDCPGEPSPSETNQGCILRHKDRFFAMAGISADLEVQQIGKTLVPVIALRGLPAELLLASSLTGKALASLQFPGGPPIDLACGASGAIYVCSPGETATRALAAALPHAKAVTVRVAVTPPGMDPLPAQSRLLQLSETPDALIRLQAAGPMQGPAPIQPLPRGWVALIDKGLKAAGYKNGSADLPPALRDTLKQ